MGRRQSRRGNRSIDGLLASTSAHLHAVEEVLVPAAGIAAGRSAVRDYRRAARRLGVSVAHAKAHEFGSTYETGVSWVTVWSELESALAQERLAEENLVAHLSDVAEADRLQEITERMEAYEQVSPTRPHPYLPHRGRSGRLMRRMMRRIDAAWDHAEGRVVPEHEHRPHAPMGLIDRYFLAAPDIPDDPSEHEIEDRATP